MTLLEPLPTEVEAEVGAVGVPAVEVVGGRYRVGELLGTGGSAVVHRAEDLRLGRQVAVKRVRHDRDNALHRLRLLDEGRALSQVTHTGFTRVLDACFDGPQPPYLVLELADGPDLAAVLAAGPLPAERVAQLGQDVAEALSHLHAQGLVHRDLKPANLLVGHDGRTRLCDLGVAARVGEADPWTRPGHTVGSIAYLAPEQVRTEPVTDRTDLYALGLVLLEALTGRREYDGSPDAAAWARVHRSPMIPTSLPAGWPALLDALTADDPADRPSAEEAAVRLAALAPAPGTSTAWVPRAAAYDPRDVETGLLETGPLLLEELEQAG